RSEASWLTSLGRKKKPKPKSSYSHKSKLQAIKSKLAAEQVDNHMEDMISFYDMEVPSDQECELPMRKKKKDQNNLDVTNEMTKSPNLHYSESSVKQKQKQTISRSPKQKKKIFKPRSDLFEATTSHVEKTPKISAKSKSRQRQYGSLDVQICKTPITPK
ncbi:unnamed protein product, partial [Owenia fusiformis]